MRLSAVVFLLALFAVTAPAGAQTQDRGTQAAGVNVGVLFPDESLEKALALEGFGEYYLTPRVSVRGLLGWANPSPDGRTEDHFREVKLLFNGVYHWDRGVWDPFVTAGAGAYFVRLLLDNQIDLPRERRGGINLGGGVEYTATDVFSVKGEARWDIVSHPAGLVDASGLTVTLGFKRYF